jgi:hypothetical protein
VTRQNKALKLLEELVSELQKSVVNERGLSAGNLRMVIMQIYEVINLIR